MIDLHTHSLLSDGVLCPAELVQRARMKGYKAIAITDHTDESNLEYVIKSLTRFVKTFPENSGITVIAGVELTHLLPEQIPKLAKEAKSLGAELIVVHGETLVEPVPSGTNRAGILAGIDILAHPGLISEKDVELAGKKGVALELSARKGHCLTNGWVAKLALKYNTKLLLNTDAHSPEDLITADLAKEIAQGAGLDEPDYSNILKSSNEFLKRIIRKRKK